MRIHLLLLASCLNVGFLASASCKKTDTEPTSQVAEAIAGPRITHGVAIGDVSATHVLLWARGDRPARLHAHLESADGSSHRGQVAVTEARDFTGRLVVTGLRPDTAYQYAVWLSTGDATHADAAAVPDSALRGTVRTAPAADETRPVRLAWGGDLAGQNVCRDRQRGFAIFEHMPATEFDLFIALGDMIYADNTCLEQGNYGNEQIPGPGRAVELAGFWRKWQYAREDRGYREFLARVPTFAVWDDHEVVNDFGPTSDTRDEAPYRAGVHLMPTGLRAFIDYNAIAPDTSEPGAPRRLYRSVRWGKHLELFFLDTRQYRAPNSASDTGAEPKSLLGSEQRAWLVRGLTGSTATWKLVVSSVPMAIPTGDPASSARDGWANFDHDTGFERELLAILREFQKAGENRTVWLTTDVHFATAFRYQPFADAEDFRVYEFVSGPLSAGLFPKRDLDPTLHGERLFFHGPDDPESVTNYDDALGWMNVGALTIDAEGALTVRIVNGRGETVFTTTLQPN